MAQRLALLALFWLSGAAGLALEVVWLRRLHLLFGGTALAVAAVTAAFMAGLGLGSVLAARRGDRSTRPLWWYGVLEIGIGIYALLIPLLLSLVLPVYALFGGWFAGMPLLLDAVRFTLAFLVLAPVTTAMGATLPLLVRQLSSAGEVGLDTGSLYAANTFGALAGVLLAGYLLLPGIGEQATTFLAASIDGVVGAGAVAWSLRARPLPPAPEALAASAPPPNHRVLLAVVGITGFASLACQVAWTRIIAMLLGSSVYAFTCIVAAVLAGISLGSAVSRRLPERWARGRTGALAAAALLAALGVLAGAAFVNRLPWTIYDLVLRAGPDGYWLVQLFIAAVLILPPAVCFGAAPPLAIRALDPLPQTASRWVGRTWAANTIGALFGAGLGGLWLVPWVGMQATLSLSAAVVVAAAVAAFRREASGTVPAGAGVLAALVLWFFAPAWSPNLLVSQPYLAAASATDIADAYESPAEFARYHGHAVHQPLFHVEGSSATVTVMEDSYHLVLRVDGKPDASSVADMDTQLLLAHIPMLLHDRPESVMVIGLGSGVTVGACALHPGTRVTAVEIEPAVVEGARFFAHVNGNALGRRNVEVVIEDARTLLLTDDRRWDVVISEPSNPWLSGPAKLFTQEFFTMVRARLAEGGLFGQWVHVYGMELEHLQSIVRTFRLVFPDLRMFVTIDGADLLLLGGSGAHPVNWDAIQERAQLPGVREQLEGTGAGGTAGICSRYLGGAAELGEWAGEGPINTDDNGFVEYGAGWRGWQKEPLGAMLEALDALEADPLPLIGAADAPERTAARLAAMAEAAAARGDGTRSYAFARRGLALHESAAGHRAMGIARTVGMAGLAAEESFRAAIALDPADDAARVALAHHLLKSGDNHEALTVLGDPGPAGDDARVLRASALEGVGESEAAFAIFAKLPAAAFEDPDIPHFERAGTAALGAGYSQAAVQFLEAAVARNPIAPRAWLLLVRAYRRSGDTMKASVLADEIRRAKAFLEAESAQLTSLYRDGPVRLGFLRRGVVEQPFDPAIAERFVEQLRLQAWDEGGRTSAAAVEALEVGRAAVRRHPGSYALAIEHAYTCSWIAATAPAEERAALYAEGARTLRAMLPLRSGLIAERRREADGRAARYERLAGGR